MTVGIALLITGHEKKLRVLSTRNVNSQKIWTGQKIFFANIEERVDKLEHELQLVNELNYQLRTRRTSFHV